MVEDAEIVSQAAAAAEEVILERFRPTAIIDLDVTVHWKDQELTVDVYIDTGAETPAEQEREQALVDEAVTAARTTVERLIDGAE